MIVIKVTKNQGINLSLEDTFSKKPPGEGGQIDPLSPSSRLRVKRLVKSSVLKLIIIAIKNYCIFYLGFKLVYDIFLNL